MKRFELRIEIFDKDYIDILIIALARQGYAPYINEDDNLVCFTVDEDDLQEIK